jgi:hypothetical protein
MPNYRFGKHPTKNDYRTLRLGTYLTPELAPPPASLNVLTRVYHNLHTTNPAVLFPMDGNDVYGDCTIAGVAHAITLYHGMIGPQEVIMSRANVIKLYMHLTGGVDSGLNELDVLNYWRQNAVDGDKILSFVSINPKNHTHVEQAIRLFGAVYLGFQVQQNCIQEFDAHQPWTPGPLTNDGHAVVAVGYNKTDINMLTWGNTQLGAWAWWDECVDEAYAILPAEAKASDFEPGFNFAQLQADLGTVAS